MPGRSETAMAEAYENRFDWPTTKLSKVYLAPRKPSGLGAASFSSVGGSSSSQSNSVRSLEESTEKETTTLGPNTDLAASLRVTACFSRTQRTWNSLGAITW